MTRQLLFAPLLGLALFAMPESASAQNPLMNLFAPLFGQPAQVRPVTANYNSMYGSRVTPYYPATNYSTVQYQQSQANCRNGSCWTPQTSATNANCANGFCSTGTCANGTCTTNRPVTTPYYPNTSYPVSTITNCQTDAYGRCITPGHPHYGQYVGNNLSPINSNFSQYRDREFLPVNYNTPTNYNLPINYNTPTNSPYFGAQLR